eukprot:TRINITY_DN9755_c0_g1_i5.p1 TRINITY_DN9755_c0_g1~~TRINITY_DN9755_c0_g1_i5.p1  ORF type:complete len:496 (+),score=98.66 TRINITY_DN9755_c0_g1_i5:240-1727(+)
MMMVIKRPSEKMGVTINEEDEPQPWTGLDLSSKHLTGLGTGLFQMPFITHLYLSKNELERLPSAIVQLTNLVVLDISYNRLRELPPNMHKLSQLRELLLSHNRIEVLPDCLGRLYKLDIFEFGSNPLINHDHLHMVHEPDKVLQLLLDKADIPPSPPDRQWIYPKDYDPTAKPSNASSVTAFCYNILCERYATRQVYRYCPSWALNWLSYRQSAIAKEIVKHSSDIICLQEVAHSAYHNFLSQELGQRGYRGIYRPKSRHATVKEADKGTVDGCAIMYHTTKFKLIKEKLIELQPTCSKYAFSCAPMLNRVMPKDNIAVFALLESLVTGQLLFVCNLHLTWDPQFKDVKVIQMLLILKEIEAFLRQEHTLNIPMLIMGDFNSEHNSGVYELLAKGKLSPDHPDLEGHDYSNLFKNVGLNHNLNLSSAYQDELPYSNYTPTFIGIIDYIWYSVDHLNPSALLGPVDEQYMEEHVDGCPNPHFPSDHLSISSQFNFY